MSEMIITTGQDCLNYIDRPIGFVNKEMLGQYVDLFQTQNINLFDMDVHRNGQNRAMQGHFTDPVTISKFKHNTNKRKIGWVRYRYDDGGIMVIVLGNEDCNYRNQANFEFHTHVLDLFGKPKYEMDSITGEYKKDSGYVFYPLVQNTEGAIGESTCHITLDATHIASFDDMLDFNPEFVSGNHSLTRGSFNYQNNSTMLTNDPTTTLIFGEGVMFSYAVRFNGEQRENPLNMCGGDLYSVCNRKSQQLYALCPERFEDGIDFDNWEAHTGDLCLSSNLVSIPYNLLLTENYNFAREYLNNGTLPPDAYLYPLDWDHLPKYNDDVPTGDEPENYDDDNTPDDDTRDFDPMPPEAPTFTVNQLTNYNWYWLDVSQWSGFINWFWNDIGNYTDFDDIIAKVKGLYNDLASGVIMCRYYPVEVGWIGGTGTPSNIKIGMIEKAGAVDTLANSALRVQDIGHVHIGGKYKSFMDMSPYSQLSLYLPWHGFIDIDVNLFTGHDLYVKALYDYMSGTIQYYIYYDNEIPVNTILCKMAMDIPITLQTKNDRDSAIFNNVSSTIGGLVGAGVGIASGNPIGMVMGVTQGIGAINSSNASAPMRLMGNVGESGAYLGCQYCAIVVRRPTIQPSDGNSQTSIAKGLKTWKHNVGMLCGYGYTLSDLKGKGFTVCHTPRIDFKNTAPMQTEVDEIYSYLEKGVIL